MTWEQLLILGGAFLVLAFLALLFVILSARKKLPLARRRFQSGDRQTTLGSASGVAIRLAERALGRRDGAVSEALELAGMRMRAADFAVLVTSSAVVAFAAGLLLQGAFLGLFFAVLAPVVAYVVVRVRTDRRRQKFGNQLEETLQMLAGGLRAGYSLPQSANTVATEAEEPTSTEFARALNESRVGRPMVEALGESAERMKSEDYYWIVQAIAINREVGGNLADVLEGVAGTIRERIQLKRQVNALAAEGKLSAAVLIGLPPFMMGFLFLVNPSYVGRLFETVLGWMMLVAAALMLLIGGLWLRSITRIKF